MKASIQHKNKIPLTITPLSQPPVIICGESYAGKYLPNLAYYVHNQNKAAGKELVKLKGVAMGNGLMKPKLQLPATVDFALFQGLIDGQQHQHATERAHTCLEYIDQNDTVAAFKECQGLVDEVRCG